MALFNLFKKKKKETQKSVQEEPDPNHLSDPGQPTADTVDLVSVIAIDDPFLITKEGAFEFTSFDTAIAAGRAVDLCEDQRFGRAVSAMTQGFLRVCRELDSEKNLSENQKETMQQLLRGMTKRLAVFFPENKS